MASDSSLYVGYSSSHGLINHRLPDADFDDVVAYQSGLTSLQIRDLMIGGPSAISAGEDNMLVAHYSFDNRTETGSVVDDSGNGFDGILEKNASIHTIPAKKLGVSVAQDAKKSALVGRIFAHDLQDEKLTYEITGGSAQKWMTIDKNKGTLTLANTDFLVPRPKEPPTLEVTVKSVIGFTDTVQLEIILFGKDADKDGLSDLDENRFYRTKPNDSDSDGDGLGDGEEIASGADPNQQDSDEDGPFRF